jgi:hypothetical protein
VGQPAQPGLAPQDAGGVRPAPLEGVEGAPYHTVCHVFVGKETPFEGREGWRLPADFYGISNTLLVVEAGTPVPWTKPEELAYDPDRPLPDLAGLFRDGFRAYTADGEFHFVTNSVPKETIRECVVRCHPDMRSSDW